MPDDKQTTSTNLTRGVYIRARICILHSVCIRHTYMMYYVRLLNYVCMYVMY